MVQYDKRFLYLSKHCIMFILSFLNKKLSDPDFIDTDGLRDVNTQIAGKQMVFTFLFKCCPWLNVASTDIFPCILTFGVFNRGWDETTWKWCEMYVCLNLVVVEKVVQSRPTL